MKTWAQRLGQLGVVLRFGAVGVAATLIHLAISAALSSWAHLEPMWSNGIGNLIGIAFSYVGHHAFTYALRGDHSLYLPKFVTVNGVLFTLSAFITYAGTRWVGLTGAQVALVVSVVYPPSSFALQHFWTFAVGRKQQASVVATIDSGT